MPVQDNDDKGVPDQPVADAEEELRKQKARSQENQQDETSVQKSGKLLPFLNAKAERHQSRIDTLDSKIAVQQDKISTHKTAIQRLSDTADRLEDKNRMLEAALGNLPLVRTFIEKNKKKIADIRENKIPAREQKIKVCEGKIAKHTAKREVITHKLNRVVALNDAINSIWYLPLKGAVLKNYYQKPGMREYSDYDILFDKTKSDKVKDIMLSLGFKMEHDDTGHDIVFFKKPVLNFEMHTHLFGIGHEPIMNNYYDNIFDRLRKDSDNRFGYHMSNEDFYIYMMAHEFKHYSTNGTGLRSLIDTYVFTSSVKMDYEYIENELVKLGIAEYEKQSNALSKKLFSGEPLNDEDKRMLEYIISSGTYGTIGNGIEHTLEKNGGSKIKYALNRFFVPIRKSNPRYLSFSKMYPKFYKNKLLICLLPFYRTYRAINNKMFGRELNELIKAKGK